MLVGLVHAVRKVRKVRGDLGSFIFGSPLENFLFSCELHEPYEPFSVCKGFQEIKVPKTVRKVRKRYLKNGSLRYTLELH